MEGYIRPSVRWKVSDLHINGSVTTLTMRKLFFRISIIKIIHSFADLYLPVGFKLTVTLVSIWMRFETRRCAHFQYSQVGGGMMMLTDKYGGLR